MGLEINSTSMIFGNWQKSTLPPWVKFVQKHAFRLSLHRPNMRTLMELYIYTVPLFGHGHLSSDPTFVPNHLLLKPSIFEEAGSRNHIRAVYSLFMED